MKTRQTTDTTRPVPAGADLAGRGGQRRVFLTVAVVVAACLATMVWYHDSHVVGWQWLGDLKVYREAARILVHRADLYSGPLAGKLSEYIYQPSAAVPFLVTLPFPTAVTSVALNLVGCLAIVWVAVVSFRSGGLSVGRTRLAALVTAVIAALWFGPVVDNQFFGQVNLVLLWLTAADVAHHSRWRGVLTGVAAGIKPTAALTVFVYACERRWHDVLRTCLGFALTVAISLAVAPSQTLHYWVRVFPALSSKMGALYSVGSESYLSAALRLSHGAGWGYAVWAVAAVVTSAVTAVGVWLSVRRNWPLVGMGLACVQASALFPVAWDHYWVWLLPAVLTLLVPMIRDRAWVPLGLSALVVVVLAARPYRWANINFYFLTPLRQLRLSTELQFQAAGYQLATIVWIAVVALYLRRTAGRATALGDAAAEQVSAAENAA